MDISDILGKRKVPRGIRGDLTYREVKELGSWEIRKLKIMNKLMTCYPDTLIITSW